MNDKMVIKTTSSAVTLNFQIISTYKEDLRAIPL